MKHLIAIFVTLFAVCSQAQTLVVSDVDDTIKLANVQDISESAKFAFDDESRFMGMSELYNAIVKDNPDITLTYLSRAPEWFMKRTHLRFLTNGKFPAGAYIGRSKYDADTHKIKSLRALIETVKPRKVILVGDNGELDPDVYAQIEKEYRPQGIEFYQFIRVVYSKTLFFNKATPLHPGQQQFVTPAEIALELEKQQLLQTQTVEDLLQVIGKGFSKQSKKSTSEFTFPEYVDCGDFEWIWDESLARFSPLPALKARIEKRCGPGSLF